MKKLLAAALFLFGCNSGDDMETVRNDIANKVPAFVGQLTGGGMMIKEFKMYNLETLDPAGAHDFRLRALSDSVIIHRNIEAYFNRIINIRTKGKASLDSANLRTDTVQMIIQRYQHRIDSNRLAAEVTQHKLDEVMAEKVSGNDKYYRAWFRICTFTLMTTNECDSFAFLLDKNRNVISMHYKTKL